MSVQQFPDLCIFRGHAIQSQLAKFPGKISVTWRPGKKFVNINLFDIFLKKLILNQKDFSCTYIKLLNIRNFKKYKTTVNTLTQDCLFLSWNCVITLSLR